MLHPRIYRAGLVAVALAVIVFAFSLQNQQGALGTTIPPDSFSGQNVGAITLALARVYPDRAPGSPGDSALAAHVAGVFGNDGFAVTQSSSVADTADGRRTIDTVIGTRTGLWSGTIVILAHRDSLSSPNPGDLSGTAALLGLARVLGGQSQHRSLALVSTSGSAGLAGADAALQLVPGPIDAVIALGDLASPRPRQPFIVPFSGGQPVAPTMLRNTVAAALSAQAGLSPGVTGLAGQIAHLALPLSLTEQAPFGAAGIPAVALTLSGERPDAVGNQPPDLPSVSALGRTVLQTVDALDTGPTVPRAVPYLELSGKIVPAWTIRLLVLAAIIPVLLALVDGLARARRRGHPVTRWLVWVLLAAVPFLLAWLLVRGAQATGILSAPPGPVGEGEFALGGGGTVVLVLAAIVIVALLALRGRAARLLIGGPARATPDPGAPLAAMALLTVTTLIVWSANPFAAALLIPALHLWLWGLDLTVPIPRLGRAALLLVGLLPPVLVVLVEAMSLGLTPSGVVSTGLLMVAGGHFGAAAVAEWSVMLACLCSAIVLILRAPARERRESAPALAAGAGIGLQYAGPGALGGPSSAMRARR